MITPAAGSLAAPPMPAAAAPAWPGAGGARDFTDGADQRRAVPDADAAPYNTAADARTEKMIDGLKPDIGMLPEYEGTAEFGSKAGRTLERHGGMPGG
ncbi:exported hypothetical protein [Nitrosopumilaceae archaeon]|nr:hypothetical protein [Nitrosopumilus sp.]MDA7945780.1 hypothetical protein [Nitrosopumilus sp.]MDA7954802.1 hypothetical protein [Nitrosopumilus sp.]MDA7974512.1 hypothetical protein [Nitrosopumilus sp.]CAI9831058.1 exported hypothetical protein [Nitrosopumilaceae archaeon]